MATLPSPPPLLFPSTLNPFFLSPIKPSSPKNHTFFFFFFPTPGRRPGNSLRARAVGEWREYEDAVREKDLARALRFLKSIETLPPLKSDTTSSSPVRYSDIFEAPERDWEVLDTCLNADDMRLVGSAYAFLRGRGLLQSFGKCKSIGELNKGLIFLCLIDDFFLALIH